MTICPIVQRRRRLTNHRDLRCTTQRPAQRSCRSSNFNFTTQTKVSYLLSTMLLNSQILAEGLRARVQKHDAAKTAKAAQRGHPLAISGISDHRQEAKPPASVAPPQQIERAVITTTALPQPAIRKRKLSQSASPAAVAEMAAAATSVKIKKRPPPLALLPPINAAPTDTSALLSFGSAARTTPIRSGKPVV